MDSDVLFLPREIIRNILKQLPVKSLIRFQCVRKDWKNLIQSPSFIADHLEQSTHQNPPLLLECDEDDIPFPCRLILLDGGLQDRGVPNPPSTHSLCDASIVGSCNGLLCLQIHERYRSPRFGFNPIVNDYKIVRTYAEFCRGVTNVEVFSLNRGTWKAIDIGNLKGVRLKSETVTVNGAIFWSGVKLVSEKKEGEDNIDFQEDEDYIEEAEDKVDVIVSFDIAKEVFTGIPRPELDYNADEKLTVYENKLAILCDIGECDDIIIGLWVLDEGTCASGQTWSWTKRYTSSPLSCTLDSMTIWRNEIVCQPDSEDKRKRNVLYMMNLSWTKTYTSSFLSCALTSMASRRNGIVCKPDSEEHDDNVLYMMNLTTNEVKRSVIPNRDSILRIYNYVESLVSVDNN
ncbi:hypothetical protein K1719_043379 [Acacia pycnantha]|nr:hypothetical protein K1719_043379 [Acacia pycnantha]